jgi:hypothetical protein
MGERKLSWDQLARDGHLPATVPFGRYKGRPIHVLRRHPEYVRRLIDEHSDPDDLLYRFPWLEYFVSA